jgi:hypothetical protein
MVPMEVGQQPRNAATILSRPEDLIRESGIERPRERASSLPNFEQAAPPLAPREISMPSMLDGSSQLPPVSPWSQESPTPKNEVMQPDISGATSEMFILK